MNPGDVRVNIEKDEPGVYLLLERRDGFAPQWNANRPVSPFEWTLLVVEADPDLDDVEGALEVVSEDFLRDWTAGLEP